MIEIDGGAGEGGGQIVRTALSLAAVTGRAVRIVRIRENRRNPGLRRQHVTAALAVRDVCGGTLVGAEVGSRELTFEPGAIRGGSRHFEVGTAGAVALVAQTLLPIALRAPDASTFRIVGGTHVAMAPTTDFLEEVFLPAVARLGVDAGAKTLRPGFFPVGGGVFELSVRPAVLRGCTEWPRGEDAAAQIRVARLPREIALRERRVLETAGIHRVEIREDDALSPGNAVTAWSGSRGACAIGARGKRAEVVAADAVESLRAEAADVDRHLADQLLVVAALAEGATSYRTSAVTGHLETNAKVVESFLPRRASLTGDGSVRIE